MKYLHAASGLMTIVAGMLLVLGVMDTTGKNGGWGMLGGALLLFAVALVVEGVGDLLSKIHGVLNDQYVATQKTNVGIGKLLNK